MNNEDIRMELLTLRNEIANLNSNLSSIINEIKRPKETAHDAVAHGLQLPLPGHENEPRICQACSDSINWSHK